MRSGRSLAVDSCTVRDLVDEAGRELAADMATDILIIEDEPLIAMDLEALVEGLGHNVTGVARTRTEAVKLASTNRPVSSSRISSLADGSSGLDAVNDLLKAFEVPVIFITAYPERFLTGERPEPAFLIAKPFQPANVSAVISQALFFQQSARRREVRALRPEVLGRPIRTRKPGLAPGFFCMLRCAKKDGLSARLKVPANAQGECGEDQEAGIFATP